MEFLKTALYCVLAAAIMFSIMWSLAWVFGKVMDPSYMYVPYVPSSLFTM